MPGGGFDAVLLAAGPGASTRVLGLTLLERARRVVTKLGARRVFVLDAAGRADELRRWRDAAPAAPLLVVRAADQLVHLPLVEPLLAGAGARRIAVTPEGEYAGALLAQADAADDVLAALAADPDGDRALAARWPDAARIAHGELARHPVAGPADRAPAARMLLRLLVKAEDGPVTRYLYRPVSRPLTRLLVETPITPNQVSLAVLVIGMIGCWLTARPGQGSLIAGAALVLAAGFIDGCDGEIARLRLLSSKLGAWLDTVVDELTTTVYFVALGYHVHLHRPDAWVVPSVVVGAACYLASIYGIYFFLIVVSKTGNSQHYVGTLDLVDDPVGLRPRRKAASTLPPIVQTIGAMFAQVVRRDFINLGAVALALADAYLPLYAAMLAGGVITAAIVLPGHVRLRGQLRELRRRGVPPRLLPAD